MIEVTLLTVTKAVSVSCPYDKTNTFKMIKPSASPD